MEARRKNSANDCKPKMGKIGRERAFFHQELNQQETEFFMMSKVREPWYTRHTKRPSTFMAREEIKSTYKRTIKCARKKVGQCAENSDSNTRSFS